MFLTCWVVFTFTFELPNSHAPQGLPQTWAHSRYSGNTYWQAKTTPPFGSYKHHPVLTGTMTSYQDQSDMSIL